MELELLRQTLPEPFPARGRRLLDGGAESEFRHPGGDHPHPCRREQVHSRMRLLEVNRLHNPLNHGRHIHRRRTGHHLAEPTGARQRRATLGDIHAPLVEGLPGRALHRATVAGDGEGQVRRLPPQVLSPTEFVGGHACGRAPWEVMPRGHEQSGDPRRVCLRDRTGRHDGEDATKLLKMRYVGPGSQAQSFSITGRQLSQPASLSRRLISQSND